MPCLQFCTERPCKRNHTKQDVHGRVCAAVLTEDAVVVDGADREVRRLNEVSCARVDVHLKVAVVGVAEAQRHEGGGARVHQLIVRALQQQQRRARRALQLKHSSN